jgi:hypothetical protein
MLFLLFVALAFGQPKVFLEQRSAYNSFLDGIGCSATNCPRIATDGTCPEVPADELQCLDGSVTRIDFKGVAARFDG